MLNEPDSGPLLIHFSSFTSSLCPIFSWCSLPPSCPIFFPTLTNRRKRSLLSQLITLYSMLVDQSVIGMSLICWKQLMNYGYLLNKSCILLAKLQEISHFNIWMLHKLAPSLLRHEKKLPENLKNKPTRDIQMDVDYSSQRQRASHSKSAACCTMKTFWSTTLAIAVPSANTLIRIVYRQNW